MASSTVSLVLSVLVVTLCNPNYVEVTGQGILGTIGDVVGILIGGLKSALAAVMTVTDDLLDVLSDIIQLENDDQEITPELAKKLLKALNVDDIKEVPKPILAVLEDFINIEEIEKILLQAEETTAESEAQTSPPTEGPSESTQSPIETTTATTEATTAAN